MYEKVKEFERQFINKAVEDEEFWKQIANKPQTYKYKRNRYYKVNKICNLVLSSSKLKHSTKLKLAEWINVDREFMLEFYNTSKNKHIYEDLINYYKNEVINPILESYSSWINYLAQSNIFDFIKLKFEDKRAFIYMGFLRAIHKFDFSSDISLKTYAYNWIKDTVLRASMQENSNVHISHSIKVGAVTKRSESNLDAVYKSMNKVDEVVFHNSSKSRKNVFDFIGTSKNEYEDAIEHLQHLLDILLDEREYSVLYSKFNLPYLRKPKINYKKDYSIKLKNILRKLKRSDIAECLNIITKGGVNVKTLCNL